MERRTGGTGSSQQETQRDLRKAANPLVKSQRFDMSTGDE
jgi:hypothetical protein